MNAAAFVCPHCGARRAGADPGLAGKALSQDEVKAIIAVHGADAEPAQGLLPTLILPHPTTHGAARAVELVCTVIALPMVILGAVTIGLARRRIRRSAEQTTGELTPVLAASFLGGLGLYSVLSIAGISSTTRLALVVASIGALVIRGIIRARESTKRSRDLHVLAKPDPVPRPSRPQLPEARVVSAPRSSGPIVMTVAPARPVEAPRASSSGSPDEPSLLK
ncbi:MAG: hypothetical protein H0T46_29115 [Deltaproteobacteria bacterium]|nr:hypothetical protein [Deltaproteobacteria bacterium]